jgi:threonine dehydrogenase-like Zn-dependent dehydrogenase
VYVVDQLSMRLSVAAGLGLQPVDATRDDVADTLKRRHGRDGIPVAFEATGSTAALNEAIRCVRRQGLVVALGFYQGEARGLFLGDEFHHNGIQIRSGQIGNVHRSTSWASLRATILQLLLHGDLVLGGLPRLTLPVEQVADGFRALTRPTDVLQVVLSYRQIDAHDTPTSHGERADGASPGRRS